MQRLGLTMDKVKAIFISHEHSDHIAGLPVLSKKYQLPVYITTGTLQHGQLDLQQDLVKPFKAYQAVQVGGLSVIAFPKFHDAKDPHSFVVTSTTVRVGIFTDIGKPCDHLIHHFKHCHAAFLETNYDEAMLQNGRYPIFLKNRIRGGEGHLSNTQALELFTTHRPSYMSHLLLSHLSKDNNDPQLVQNLFDQHTTHTKIVVASRFVETPVFYIQGDAQPLTTISRPIMVKRNSLLPVRPPQVQLRLF
jgi:phosphoribosyl 1,2-cyclic phosphodiesterase